MNEQNGNVTVENGQRVQQTVEQPAVQQPVQQAAAPAQTAEPPKQNWLSAVVCLVGLIPLMLMRAWLRPVLTDWLGSHWGKLVYSVVHAFYYIALFPLVLKLVGKARGQQA